MKQPLAVGYVEVTVALAMMVPGGALLHDEMADATIAFYLPTGPSPRLLTEEAVREDIRLNLPRLLALVESAFLVNGAVHGGQVDEPMTEHSRETGRSMSDPITARIQVVGEARA